jgi:hypothetical protein
MLGIPVRYFLKHPVTTVTDVAADPLQLWMTIQDEYAAQREGSRAKYQYEFDANWEQRLHESLGVRWPCDATAEFWTAWSRANGELETKGIKPGPESFQWSNVTAMLGSPGRFGVSLAICGRTRSSRPASRMASPSAAFSRRWIETETVTCGASTFRQWTDSGGNRSAQPLASQSRSALIFGVSTRKGCSGSF